MVLKYDKKFGIGSQIRAYDFPGVPDFYIEGTIIGIKENTNPRAFVVYCTKDSKPGGFLQSTKVLVPIEKEEDIAFGFERIQQKPSDGSFDPSSEIKAYLEKIGKYKGEDVESLIQILIIFFHDIKKKHLSRGIEEPEANELSMNEVESYVQSQELL